MAKKYTYEYAKKCINCGKEFTTKRYATKTCSSECVSQILKKQKTVYTSEQKLQAIQLRKQGITTKEISQKLNIKVPTLDKWFIEESVILSKEQYNKNVAGARWKRYAPVVDGQKQCSKCNQFKDVHDFPFDKRKKSRLSSSCKKCQQEFYLKNSSKIKEKVREYRSKNLEKIKEMNRNYYEGNQDKVKRNAYAWSAKNPEKRKEIGRKYRQNNAEQKRHRLAMYRAKKAQATPKWLTDSQKEEIRQIYMNCPEGHHVDHIVPINAENACGLHVPWNLQYLPEILNEAKSNSMEYDLSSVGVCHQYKRRLETLEEDVAAGLPTNLKVNDFSFSFELMSDEHRKFIERYEWLGTVGFGVRWVFTARHNGVLGGVVMISEPNGYSSFGMEYECLIQRGACASWTPKNLGSAIVMFSCRWMLNNTPKRLFVAYSDPSAGEIGTIYQACNFEYMGAFYGAKTLYQLPSGKWVNARYFTRTNAMKRWAKELGIAWQKEWCKPNGFQDVKAIPKDILNKLREHGRDIMHKLPQKTIPPKGKYALLLWKNKSERKYLESKKNWVALPYPKRSGLDLPAAATVSSFPNLA